MNKPTIFETIEFFAEILSFFFSGYALAIGYYYDSIVLMSLGLLLAFLVGDSIYNRGKNA